jgi:hypothetical protein
MAVPAHLLLERFTQHGLPSSKTKADEIFLIPAVLMPLNLITIKLQGQLTGITLRLLQSYALGDIPVQRLNT